MHICKHTLHYTYIQSLANYEKSKTRRMAIANRTCVSFCNQPKAHYLATSRESRRYVVAFSRTAGEAFGYVKRARESKAHFGLPWVRPWDNRGTCYMDRKRIQRLSNTSQHVPIYFQPFPSNSTCKFKSSPFQHIFCTFWPPAPGTIAVNVTWIEREFNAGQTPRSIYPSIFNHF